MRYAMLAATFLMQVCMGATYAWPLFLAPLRAASGQGQGAAQLPYTLFYILFPLAVIFGATRLRALGPRRSAMLGGALYGAGWLVAAAGALHWSFVALGLGVLAGTGCGLFFMVPLATCVLWFPKRKGLVTGFVVSGVGLSGALLAPPIAALLAAGWSPFKVFALMGGCFLTILLPGSLLLRPPPDSDPTECPAVPLRELLAEHPFRMLFAAMAIALGAGFAINANLRELLADAGGSALQGVVLFAVCSTAGRMGWGALFDQRGSGQVIRLNLALQGILLLAAGPLLLGTPCAWLLAGLAGFNHGGANVLFASATARLWSAERVGPVYGWLFAANLPASLAPLAAGWVYDQTESFAPALVALGAGLLLAAWITRINRPAAVMREEARSRRGWRRIIGRRDHSA